MIRKIRDIRQNSMYDAKWNVVPRIYASIPNPTGWWTSAVVTKDGDNLVSQIDDMSGNGYHAVQETQANKFLYVADEWNGNPILRGDGTKWASGSFGKTFAQPNTYYIVWKNTGETNVVSIVFNQIHYIAHGSDSKVWVYPGAGAISVVYSKTSPYAQHIITTGIFNGANGKVFEDGVEKGSGNVGTTAAGSDFTIGRSTSSLRGDWGETLFYDKLLTATEDAIILQYLKSKYGLV